MSGDQLAVLGLSPLARGTPTFPISPLNSVRFIPAGAGNTGIELLPRFLRAVYPRWRGEHQDRFYHCDGDIGLSPLARGTPAATGGNSNAVRFIPAGAGNTAWFCAEPPEPPVYPRWRGEHNCGCSSMLE